MEPRLCVEVCSRSSKASTHAGAGASLAACRWRLSEIVKGVDAAESAVWIRLISRSPTRAPLSVERGDVKRRHKHSAAVQRTTVF
jgi:hypothetical protein